MSFGYGDWNYIVVNQATWFGAGYGPCFQRHNNGANYGFVDGHAKWLVVQSVGNTSTSGPFGGGPYAAWFAPSGN
jgi:prepilin-type processing-associated H-X9-DG protein